MKRRRLLINLLVFIAGFACGYLLFHYLTNPCVNLLLMESQDTQT